uniref:Uncharacterized protein n=1 Tax=Nelumbo nucifera TaxID=4432 RepID=A0A822Y895_NELNU|nr:TPA_asm: hypothetical protein HUJ06_028997 [Nelumbo nucifera]
MRSQAIASRGSASVPKPDSFHGHLARILDDLARMQLPKSNLELLCGRGRGGAVSFAGKPVSMENVGGFRSAAATGCSSSDGKRKKKREEEEEERERASERAREKKRGEEIDITSIIDVIKR